MLPKWLKSNEAISLLLFLICFGTFSIMESAFFSPGSLTNLAILSSEVGLITLGEAILLTAGELDLSVASVFALSSYIFLGLAYKTSIPLAFFLTLMCGLSIGFINGYLTVRSKIPSFITTLGGLILWRGLLGALSRGESIMYYGEKTTLLSKVVAGNVGFFPSVFLWFIGLAILFTILLNRTKFGNHVLAVGANVIVARNMGVPVERVKILSFIICSLMATFAGCAYFNRRFFSATQIFVGGELQVVAAAVIGGTLLGGGMGSMLGAALGALTVLAIQQGLAIYGIPVELYNSAVGVILLVLAAVYHQYRKIG